MSDEHTLDKDSGSDSFTDAASRSDEVTMPLGMGDFEVEEAMLAAGADDGEKNGRSGGLMLIGAVVVMAIGGLFLMNTLSKITGASKDEIDVNDKQWNPLVTSGNGSIAIPGLVAGIADMQIPWDDLQRDPFILMLGIGDRATDDKADPGAGARDRRLAEIDSAATRLRLQSVMGGRQPLAIINGETMRIGDVLAIANSDVTFRVVAITRGSVTITSVDPKLTLNVKKVLTLQRP